MLNNSNDKIIGLIGKNIGGSLSPKIHNFLSNVMGLKYHYFLFDIKENDLKKAVESIKILNIKGVNVTIPYKKEVIQYLDEVDGRVKEIGAVNTIINKNGKLIGFNTDVDGFDEMCYSKGASFKDKNVILLGAGGSARAVLYYLKNNDVNKLSIINRTLDNAKELKNKYSKDFNKIVVLKLNSEECKKDITNSDIIINTTPLGMKDRFEDKSPVSKELINGEQILIDLVYNPRITKFLEIGKNKNARIISGIEMLVFQAVKSFELWTDTMIDYHVINELINNL